MRKYKLLSAFMLLCFIAKAENGNEIMLTSAQGNMRIQLCNDRTVRITKSADTHFEENEPWMVTRYAFEPVSYQRSTDGDATIIKTSQLTLRILPNPWRVELKDFQDNTLYRETDCQLPVEGKSLSTECVLQPDEHFFGFGERMDKLDQRGQKIHLNVELGRGPKPAVGGKDILRAGYCPVPFFMSSKGYALFFHTAAPTDWDMGWSRKDCYTYSAPAGELDYYLIVGPEMASMLHDYQMLTGVSPMMPRTAYGLHLGSYSGGTWKHEKEASPEYNVNLAKRMRKEGIPFDLMWLDSTWRIFNSRYGNGGCTFEFQEQFTHPKAMIDSVYAQHVDMFGLHIRSILDDGQHTRLFEEGKAAGVFMPGAQTEGIVNFFDQKAVDWWWDHAMEKITKLGVKFVKTDVGSALRMKADFKPQGQFSSEELHNLFPIAYAKAPYEKFIKHNGQRGFTHTREGYAGIQRYPFIWAGDWGTEWQWFEPVIRAGLNIGLSGVGHWSHCMGGFEQYSPYDNDLYVRWCQFGMFSPVAILFGMDHPRYHEPWTYGDEAMKIFIKYDSLRYTLIPYIYSSAYEMYKTSRPIMAPLLFDYQNDELTYSISDQYFFGHSMMICPVTVKGALSRPVYFPGGDWVDFWTGERISGHQWKSFLTPPDLMPIFIREGAIIPRQAVLQYIGEKPVETISLLVYPSGKSTYQLYDDDGKSLDYQQGILALTPIHSEVINGRWTLTIGQPEGAYHEAVRNYCVEAYWKEKPATVTVNGKVLKKADNQNSLSQDKGWFFDETAGKLFINPKVNNQKTIEICVE